MSTEDIDITSATAVTAISNWFQLGSVERFEESNTRATTERYELNSDNPGEILERIPELTKRSLTLQKVVLYTQDMMELFGTTNFDDIIDNYKAFSIQKLESIPEGSTALARTTYYTGCWFHDNPKSYDISRELKMVQSVTIGFTRRFVSKTSTTTP